MLTFPRIVSSMLDQIQICIKNFPVSPIRLGRTRETIERGGPCWLLELRWTGTLRGDKWKWKGSFPGWFVGLVVPVQEIFVQCLSCSSRPSTKYFFLAEHYFNAFTPSAQQAGQPAVLGRLSLSVCLWEERYQSSDADALNAFSFFLIGQFKGLWHKTFAPISWCLNS